MGLRNVGDLSLLPVRYRQSSRGKVSTTFNQKIHYITVTHVMCSTLSIQQSNGFYTHVCEWAKPDRTKSSSFCLHLSLPRSLSLPTASLLYYSPLLIRAVGERVSLFFLFCFDTAILSSSYYFFRVSN